MEQDFEYDPEENQNNFIPRGHKKRRKTLLIVLFGLLLVLFATGGYFIFLKYKFNKMISGRKATTIEEVSNLSNPGNLRGENLGDINILFVGMRNKNMEGAYLSSAIMVVNIDVKSNKMNLISIPRDLWISIDSKYGKANSVYKTVALNTEKYPENGLPFIKKTFSDVLGVEINYALVCDFDSFQKIINRIGAVDVIMSESEASGYPFLSYEEYKGSRDAKDPTLYHLNGEQSLTFVRWPEDSVPDFDRLRRMQLYIFSFKKQYLKASAMLNPSKTNEILNITADNVKMDMQLWEITKLVNLVSKITPQDISQYQLTTNINTDGGLLKESYYQETTYNPLLGDRDFSDIQSWAKNIITK